MLPLSSGQRCRYSLHAVAVFCPPRICERKVGLRRRREPHGPCAAGAGPTGAAPRPPGSEPLGSRSWNLREGFGALSKLRLTGPALTRRDSEHRRTAAGSAERQPAAHGCCNSASVRRRRCMRSLNRLTCIAATVARRAAEQDDPHHIRCGCGRTQLSSCCRGCSHGPRQQSVRPGLYWVSLTALLLKAVLA